MSVIDGMTEARLNGYGWDEINGHLADATDTALAAGYTPEEIDAHLGYKDPSILHSQLSDIAPETPPTASTEQPQPVDPNVASAYAKAVADGSASGPSDFMDVLGQAWGLDPETSAQMQSQLPSPEDAIDHGIAVAHMNGDDPFSGAITASQNMFDLWAQTGMTPQEVVASRDPLLIDALTKEQPADHPTIEEAAQIKMPTLAELQDQAGRDAISHFQGSESDPIGLFGFLKDLYNLPATAADYRDETEKMRAEGKDVSERWKDDPGLNFIADTLVTGGVLKGAHLGVAGIKGIAEHPIIQDILHDESGSINIGKVVELAGEKVKEAPKEPPAEGETPQSTLTAEGQLSPEQAAELQKAQVKPAIDEAVNNLGTAKADPEPELPLPEGITKADITRYVTKLDREINLLRSNAAADTAEMWNMLQAEPADWMKPDFLSRVSREVEQRLGNPGAEVSPEVQEFLDAHKSLTDKQHALAREEAELLGRDPSGLRTVDEGHVHRVVKGQENLGSALDPETYRDPITGAKPRSLTKYDPGMKSRADFYVFEDEAGNRNWGSRPLEETGHAMGDPVEDATGRYTIKPARMDEIEANTDIRYRDNFLANLVQDVNQRSRVVRNLRLIQTMVPELEKARLFKRGPEPVSGMEKVDLPQMDGYAHPRIANVLNDFYQMAHERGDLNHYLGAATRALVMSLFISPMKHLRNEAAHFIPARGEDWIAPRGIGRLWRNSGDAMHDVLSFGPDYIEYLRAGGSPLYVGARTRNFQQVMMSKFFHEQMADAGGLWSQFAKWSGMSTVKNMVAAEYQWSNRTLWAGGDMMRMFLYKEAKEKGMSPTEAVADVNRNMPSYQIPTEVLMPNRAGHALSELLKSPYLFVFGRYRYGQIATIANHVRDFVGPGQTLGERREALAKLVTLGGLYYGMALMGQYAGGGTLIHAAQGLLTGEKNWQSALGSWATLGPLLDLVNMGRNNIDRYGEKIWRTGGTALGNVTHATEAAIGAFPIGQMVQDLFTPGKGLKKVLANLAGWDVAKEPVDPAKKAAWEKRQAAQSLAAERKDAVETWVRNMLGDPLPAPVGHGGGAGGAGGHSSSGGGHSGGGIVMRGSGSQRSAPGLDSGGVVLRGQGYAPRQTGAQAAFPAGGNGIVAGENPAPQPASSRTSSGRGGGRSRRFYYSRRRR